MNILKSSPRYMSFKGETQESESNQVQDSFRSQDIQAHPKRFLTLALFSCCTCLNALAWIMYSPIFILLQDLYGVKLIAVQYLALSYMILYLPTNIPAVITLEKQGLRVGVVVGIGMTALG